MDIVVPDEFKYLYEHSAERPVTKIPAAVLRQKATDVESVSPKIEKLINEMLKVLKKANGVGLAAPQLSVGKRVIIVSPLDMKPLVLINPVITEADGEQIGQEGCLSIPGLYGDVKRASRIVVDAYDRRGRSVTYDMEGMAARIVQHEVDHLDGILFVDKVDISTLHWEHPGGPDDQDAE